MTPSGLWRFAKAAYIVVVLVLFAWVLSALPSVSRDWLRWVTSAGGLWFIAGWMAMATMLGWAWARIVRASLGLRLPPVEWLPIQAAAWAGRYLPGKLGLLAGKLPLAERAGVGWRQVTYSVLFEQVAFVATGAALFLVLPWPAMASEWVQQHAPGLGASQVRWGIAVALLLALAVAMRLAGRRMGVAQRLDARFFAIVCCYAVAHGLAGLGLFGLLRAEYPAAHELTLGLSIALLALANVAGILAVFAPAGLGVREAVIVAGTSAYIPLTDAIALAAALRVLSIIADGVFCLWAWCVPRLVNRFA